MTTLAHLSADRRIQQLASPDRLLHRARLLDTKDQAILRAILDPSISRRQIAQLAGITEGALARRVRRLMNRLHDPTVIALIDHGKALRPDIRQVAMAHLLHGQSIATLAARQQVSSRQIAATIQFAHGWARGLSSRTP